MSGRPRSIDRDKVLDAAETVVTELGASGLSFDAVAKAAGITKSGVQYCFGTKDNLIRAMIARWVDAYETKVMKQAGPSPSAQSVIRAHLSVTKDEDEEEHSRSAVMMTALLEAPERVAESREWYNGFLARLDLSRPADRQIAVAFLAGEGAFLLKALGLISLSEAHWHALFTDMLKLTHTDGETNLPQNPRGT